jgi:hypothetical protein
VFLNWLSIDPVVSFVIDILFVFCVIVGHCLCIGGLRCRGNGGCRPFTSWEKLEMRRCRINKI